MSFVHPATTGDYMNYDEVFWYLLRQEVDKSPGLFTTMSESDQVAVIARVDAAAERVMAGAHDGSGGGEGGGNGGPSRMVAEIVHFSHGSSSIAPTPRVNLGKQVQEDMPLPDHSGCTGIVRPYEGGIAVINFGPNDFVIPPDQLPFAPLQVLVANPGTGQPMMPPVELAWEDADTVTIPADSVKILRPKPVAEPPQA